jgi:hypothetical protein
VLSRLVGYDDGTRSQRVLSGRQKDYKRDTRVATGSWIERKGGKEELELSFNFRVRVRDEFSVRL